MRRHQGADAPARRYNDPYERPGHARAGLMNATSTGGGRLSLPLWNERYAAPLAPTTAAEMRARGWDCVDVVFVSGDAYVDHPSFAMALLARTLEAAGFRVG